MALTTKPDDFRFEVQGTQYFMRYDMDPDIGEVFLAARFDATSEEWSGIVFQDATQHAVDYYGGGTVRGLVEFNINQVNTILEQDHGEPPTETLLSQEKAMLTNNVVLENERLKMRD
jgi:hypothetical protein